MRRVSSTEKNKRGCPYCLDYQKKRFEGVRRFVCIHDKCPYHELDKYKTYREYLKKTGDLIFLRRKDKK